MCFHDRINKTNVDYEAKPNDDTNFILSSDSNSVNQRVSILQKTKWYRKFLRIAKLTWKMFHAKEPLVLGGTVQNRQALGTVHH